MSKGIGKFLRLGSGGNEVWASDTICMLTIPNLNLRP